MNDGSSRGAASPFGVWDQAMRELISYRYLGCSSVQIDRDRALGRMPLRRDMRSGAGLLSAPLAIAMLDTAGICIDRVYHLGLTHIEVQLVDPALDVTDLRVVGRVVRWARTQLFTEAMFYADDDPDRVIGVGTADWAVIRPTPDGFVYTDPAGAVGDEPGLPPLAQAFDAVPIAGGYEIARLSSRIGTDTLHHGPILVTLEATAIDLATATAAGRGAVAVENSSVRIVRAGRGGPFRTVGVVLRDSDFRDNAGLLVRTEMIDHGNDDAVVAVGYFRVAVVVTGGTGSRPSR